MVYNGKKFYCSKVTRVRNEAVWWAEEYVEKKEFAMTDSYRKWLHEKAKKERQEELMVMRSKLEYQMKTYGQVDEIDFQEYMAKVQMWA